MKKIFAGLFVLICGLSLFACDFSSPEQFGYFTHNGYALKTFVSNDLNFSEASEMLTKNSISSTSAINDVSSVSFGNVLTSEQIVQIKKMFSSVKINITFFNDENNQITERFELSVTTMGEMLEGNTYNVAGGSIVVNNIALTADLLTHYENLNEEFKNSTKSENAPYNNMYSYHTDTNGNFVLAVNDYSDNGSTIIGSSTTEIHQTQSQYNELNLITRYQSSFGFRYHSPSGTQYVGSVLEVTFDWIDKYN